jgi:hypothetical protein
VKPARRRPQSGKAQIKNIMNKRRLFLLGG